jgi:hypothetical protein
VLAAARVLVRARARAAASKELALARQVRPNRMRPVAAAEMRGPLQVQVLG